MKYGFFDDNNKEYVITTPKTPLPWINYLGCTDFFTLISNTCGGYTFYKDAKLLRMTRYRYNDTTPDTNGKYFYIKDGDTIWNPGWQPIEAALTTFVPIGDPVELTKVTLTNKGNAKKDITLFSYVEWCLWNADDDMKNYQRNLSIGEVEVIDSTIYHKTEYRERRNHYAVYSVNTKIDGFETSRDEFRGAYNGPDKPAAVIEGKLHNTIASGWYPIASHQINVSLEAGESKTFVFALGYVENAEDDKWEAPGIINKKKANALLAKYQTTEDFDKAFAALNAYWNDLLSKFHIESKDEHVNRMVNIWNQYQCMVTFNMSRSASYYETGIGRGMGFRDSCQDLLGFVHLIPDRARERIIDIASTQFQDGSAYHQYQPLTKKGNSDIGSGFNAYDNDMSVATTLMEHLKRSFDYIVNHKGPHDLPLIGRADWNDCLNLNCFSEHPGESFQCFGPSEGPVAESVFIAGMFVKYGREYADLCKLMGDNAEADRVLAEVDKMIKAIEKDGWDGEWFVRAYDAYSHKVGSKECDEGQIYIEPQGMCVMAGVGIEDGKAKKALDSVKEKLDTKYGVMILQPAYTRYHLELGEITSYPPGYKENAGIFCHNNPWISIAETCIGRGDRAFEVYKKTCPSYIEDISEIHRTEPYVYSQMVAGADAKFHGEAKNSWLTGTAAWTFTNISQYILGIYPTLEGLSVNPCIPAEFGDFNITRVYRGVTYNIEIKNPNKVQKGVASLTVDGVEVAGNVIPFDGSKKTVSVVATMK